MKSRKIVFILLSLSLTFFLYACHQNSAQEHITVFDSTNQQILETSNPQTVNFFYNLLDEIDEDEVDEDLEVDLPSDAQINYSYHYISRKGGSAIRFTTYKNYPYITVSNIPALPDITFKLDDDSNTSLNHPNTWIK